MGLVSSVAMGATRGSVGNVTYRRANGKTIASQKVTNVKNPRSWAQAEQRMRMAAATTFYSPLSDVLAKAWQGKNRTESMGEFTKSAIATMREGGFGFVKTWPTLRPYPFQVSKGSLPSIMGGEVGTEEWDGLAEAGLVAADTVLALPVDTDVLTAGQVFNLITSYIGMDNLRSLQLTFVIVLADTDASGVLIHRTQYGRVQLSPGDNRLFSTLLPSFVSQSGGLAGEPFFFNILNTIPSVATVAFACIISGYDGRKWLRSTERMIVAPYWVRSLQSAYNVGVESFMDAAAVGDAVGDVYLDGEGTTRGGAAAVSYPATSAGTAVTVVGFAWYDVTVGGDAVSVASAVLSDGRTLPISGGTSMASFDKLFTRAGGVVTKPNGQLVVENNWQTSAQVAYWQWVSSASGLPLSLFYFGA